ncbi:MAG: NAD(P)/FAD-dependent oxidoreductase [Euryarchaeota archaeon]|nr:NAD(P)/FAD-dependent oxidoreductase [Euryarchaeota archaeon]
MYDVVVIGGNLAGATAAINAALEGASVALIERNQEPFFPPHCGELIPDSTAESLHLDKIGCSSNEISTMIFTLSQKKYIFNLKKHKFVMFDRYCVEKHLLKEAKRVGVDVKLGVRMKDFKPPFEIFLDDNHIIKGRIIIDASGIACCVGNRIEVDTKLRPGDIGVCIQSRVQGDFKKDTTDWYFHNPYAPFGYAWLFPFNDNMANIGLIVTGGQKLDLAKMLKNYIGDMTKGRYKITSTFRASVPIAKPLRRLIKDNVMIVGDAARLSHAVSGGGIDNALSSGRLAGRIASKYIHKEISSLEAYQHAMRLRLLRLRMEHKAKSRAIESDERFVKRYQGIFSVLSFVNRLFPNVSHINLLAGLENIST